MIADKLVKNNDSQNIQAWIIKESRLGNKDTGSTCSKQNQRGKQGWITNYVS